MVNALGIALSGLNVSKTAVDNVSNNIANENTQGYIKRTTNLSELSLSDDFQSGVEISSVERQTNEYIKIKLNEENSSLSYLEQLDYIYNLSETIFSETDETGLSVSLSNFFEDLENYRADSSDSIYKSNVESSANILVQEMQSIYDDLLDLEDSLTKETYDQVDSVNLLLEQIVNINSDIQQYGESNDLLDKRDLLESQLAQYVDIEVNTDNGYHLDIAGQTAVYNNLMSYELNVVESPTSQKNVYTTSQLNDDNLGASTNINLNLNNSYSIDIAIDVTGSDNYDVKRQIVDAINTNSNYANYIEASLSDSGNLVIESKTTGEEAAFNLSITIDNTTSIEKNENSSTLATNDLHIEVLDEEIELESGSLKALTENLTTNNSLNYISDFKSVLNDLASMLSDVTSAYVQTSDDEYIYGSSDTLTYSDQTEVNLLNLFSGSSVSTLTFNESSLDSLVQSDLDYLASIQWKDDFNFSSTGEKSSFSEALQSLRVDVSSKKENISLKLETQESITVSLQSTYDQLTKVDTDEEMIYLMQFQAAYEANAKVITAVDEMLETLLAM